MRRLPWLVPLLGLLVLAAPEKSSAQKGKPAICQVQGVICQGEENITSFLLEMVPQARKFTQFERVSGAGPLVETHEAKSVSYGFGLVGGMRLFGDDRPVFAMLGAQFDAGLETNTVFSDGSSVHGDVSMYGLGIGLRMHPFRKGRVEGFMQAMLYSQWNRGKFDIDDGIPRSETRKHVTATGDYTAGLILSLTPAVGIEIGAGYNGQFNKDNADENLRVLFGLTLTSRQVF